MKLTFSVEADTEEELKPYARVMDWYGLAADFARWLREKWKYGDSPTIAVEEVREEFFRLLRERELDL